MERLVELEIEVGDEYVKLDQLGQKKKGLETGIKNTTAQLELFKQEAQKVISVNEKNVFQWDAGTTTMKNLAASVGITEDNFVSWAHVVTELTEKQTKLQGELDNTDAEISSHESYIAELESAIEALNGEIDTFGEKAQSALAEGEKVGAALGDGVASGINSRVSSVRAAAGGLTRAAIGAMKTVAMIQSPSKKARKEVGQQIGEGEVLGLEDKIPDVKKASEKLINAIDLTPNVPDIPVMGNVQAGESNCVREILNILNQMLPKMGQNIVLDTGELVGATVGAYDSSLGQLQKRRARYE